LEFLGDAVLGFLASDYLYRRFPAYPEGKLTPMKAAMVNKLRLHAVAAGLGLGSFLRLGKGEERSGGRSKRALLANSMEALLGAVYLDGGVERSREIAHRLIFSAFATEADYDADIHQDSKGALQALTQVSKMPMPRYTVIEENGPVHARVFTVEVRVGKDLAARAEGTSKKAASLKAAEALLDQLRRSGAAAGPSIGTAAGTDLLRSG
jgi:ribonuclease-3